MYISVNEKLVNSEEIELVSSEGFNFGFGLFETIKVERSKPVFLKEHIDRISKGLKRIGLSFDFESSNVSETSKELIEKNELKDGALKLIASKNKVSIDIFLSTRETVYEEEMYEKGFSLKISETKRNPYSVIPYLKSLNYMENMLERNKAVSEGYDDCLFLNTDGAVAETSISNIFFVKDDSVFTPKIETGILNGIVREKTLKILKKDKVKVTEDSFALGDILDSKEVFVTNSLMGIMPVKRIKDHYFDLKSNFTTRKLQRIYREVLNEELGL